MYETTKYATFRYDTVEVENGLKANCVLQVISNGMIHMSKSKPDTIEKNSSNI